MPEFIHGEEKRALLGACFEVYREKGCGFLEAVFQECLEIELTDRKVPFQVQPLLGLEYKVNKNISLTFSASAKSSWRLRPFQSWLTNTGRSYTTT